MPLNPANSDMPTAIDIDLSRLTRREQLPEQLALAFNFPEYHGQNWDGFWACVSTLEEMPAQIRIKGMKALAHAFPLEAALLKKYLQDFRATPKGARVEIVFD